MFHRLKKVNSNPVLFGLLLIVLVIGIFLLNRKDDGKFISPNSDQTSTGPLTSIASGSKVNLSPPSTAQKNDSEAHKDQIVQKNVNIESQQSGQTKVVITDVNSTNVRAYIQGVFEDGGTCTATAKQGQRITSSTASSGFKNVSYTQCAPMNWDTPLTPGEWVINLNYKSNSTQSSGTVTRSL